MILIDSSGWLEYFADGPNARSFAEAILHHQPQDILVPTIIMYELFKKIALERGENIAIYLVGQLKTFCIIPLEEDIAITAAKVSMMHRLPMADSIIYATAQKYNAVVWTQDEDFKKLPGTKFIQKKIK
jgi:predicted nucleic acid-binding protein